MSWWSTWIHRRKERRLDALRRELAQDIFAETYRLGVRFSFAEMTWLFGETKRQAIDRGWDTHHPPTPDALRDLITDVLGRPEPQPEPEPPRWDEADHQRWYEEWQAEKREQLEAEAREEARQRAFEEHVQSLLAEAGLPADRTEVKITKLLLARRQDVTAADVGNAVKAYEVAYNTRVQRFKDSGGQAAWPTQDAVITSIFGTQAPE